MAKLKTLKLLAFAKLQAVIMAIVGLIAGILYSFGGLIIDCARKHRVGLLRLRVDAGTSFWYSACIWSTHSYADHLCNVRIYGRTY